MEKIGRLGYLGLAIEAVAGTPESSPDTFIPFTENSLRGHHEPLVDEASRASRVMNYGAVTGKRWGEGSVGQYLDSIQSGYALKMAFGQEAVATLSADPPVYDHLFTPTISGNAVTSATLWDYKGVDVEQYAYAAVDTLDLEVMNDGIATLTAGFMAAPPSTVSAPTLTTVSGTLFTWKDMNAYFGSTVQAALGASATKLTNFKMNLANNLELLYKSGNSAPAAIVTKQLEVTGSFTMYFDSVTQRDAYYNLTKNSMVVNLGGANIGAGYTERLQLVVKKLFHEDIDMETGLDDLFAITCNYRALWDQDQAGFVEMTLRNQKSSAYA